MMMTILTFIQSIPEETVQSMVMDIFFTHKERMLKIACGILHNYHDAEDAVQDAIYSITDHAEAFREIDADEIAALVSTYTRNAAVSLYRKNQRFSKYFDTCETMDDIYTDDNDDEDVLRWLLKSERSKMLERAVNALEKMYREVIILKYYEYMGNEQIAEILHIEYSQVGGRLFRAKKQLYIVLKEMGYERFA